METGRTSGGSQGTTRWGDSALEPGRARSVKVLSDLRQWCDALRVSQLRRRLHPITIYRAFALASGMLIVLLGMHLDSTIITIAPALLVAAVHLGLSHCILQRLSQWSLWINAAVIAVDMLACVWLVSATHGWDGPLWLYGLSAVFWPAARFGKRGAIIAVAGFSLLLLTLEWDRVVAAWNDSAAGEVAAQLAMVGLLAAGIVFTVRILDRTNANATEAERNRIARDLHDGVGKTMGGISLEASTLVHWIDRDLDEARRRAQHVSRISQKAAVDVRDVIRDLRRPGARALLFASVRECVDDWQRAHPGVQTELRLNGIDEPIPHLIHGEILQLLGELLGNVARHSSAAEVVVRMTMSTSGVTLCVRDNGVGFAMEGLDPWDGSGHFGLLGARERVSLLSGHLRVKQCEPKGTVVTIDLPLVARERGVVYAAS